MPLTKTEKEVLDLIVHGGTLKRDLKGYFYIVPTTYRRSGKMRVSSNMVANINKHLPENKQIPPYE